MNRDYTGRKIAIFTDIHGLLEPLEAVINDIYNRNIYEIYSLGDNTSVGPCPAEVIDMLECYNVKSVLGNAEGYCVLGIMPYRFSFDNEKMRCHEWTITQLGSRRIDFIKSFPISYDLSIGGKKVGLCHFANDIRIDYGLYGESKYLYNYNSGCAYQQFLYTNSVEQIDRINYNLDRFGYDDFRMSGYVSAKVNPIFDGKSVNYYDSIIQGHMHRDMYESSNVTEFITIRAMAVHFDKYPIDLAFYIILHERTNNNGYDIEKVYVPFDRKGMEDTIRRSDEPSGKIRKLVRMV